MNIHSIQDFMPYYDKVKARTLKVITYIPEEHIEWTFRSGKFTLGDIVRHLALLERQMFAENLQGRPSTYRDCGVHHARGKKQVVDLYELLGSECRGIYAALSDEDLRRKCRTPADVDISAWKWLRAMIEHEVHHRAQIYTYLAMLEVQAPPLYGLTSEEVAHRSQGS